MTMHNFDNMDKYLIFKIDHCGELKYDFKVKPILTFNMERSTSKNKFPKCHRMS